MFRAAFLREKYTLYRCWRYVSPVLRDARNVDTDEVVQADLCIVGAGPAGLTIAKAFVGGPVRVCVLAGGGQSFDARAQALYEMSTQGDPYLAPIDNRRRQLGGTSNMWSVKIGNGELGVRYAPLEPIDFESRPWMNNDGWPFGRDVLQPYYEQANQIAQVGRYGYRAEDWETRKSKRFRR